MMTFPELHYTTARTAQFACVVRALLRPDPASVLPDDHPLANDEAINLQLNR